MEPRPDTYRLKLCNEFPGFTHLTKARPFPLTEDITMSVPRSHLSHPTDTIPSESIADLERLIDKCLPKFRGRELINQGMCWCTDTVDADWLLCEDPRWKGLVLATGDSGHTFKMLPVVGAQVADLIEGKVSQVVERVQMKRADRCDFSCQPRRNTCGGGDQVQGIRMVPGGVVHLPRTSLTSPDGVTTRTRKYEDPS